MDDSKNSSITKAPQHGGGAAFGELLGWNPLQLQSHLVCTLAPPCVAGEGSTGGREWQLSQMGSIGRTAPHSQLMSQMFTFPMAPFY